MALDANIFAQFGTRPRGMGEYRAELDAQAANALALKSGQLGYQNALQATQDEAAYREATKGFGPDAVANLSLLRSKGLGKQAIGYEKAMLDQQKVRADINQSNAAAKSSESAAAKNQYETFKAKLNTGMQILQNANSPQAVMAMVQASVQQGMMTPEEAQQNVSDMPQDPAAFAQWRQGQLIEGMDIGKRLEAQRQAADAQERARHNRASEGLQASGQRQQMAIANMTDARQREMATITKENAAATRKEAADEKAVTKYSDTLQKEGIPELETAVSGAESVLNKYKKGEVPGIGRAKNALPAFMMSDEGKDTRQALAQVRNIVLSARSGAAVTDQELRRLVEEIGTGVGMSEDDIRRGLQRIRDRLETIKTNAAAGVSDTVKSTYEDRGGIKIKRGGQSAPAAGGFKYLGTE